MPQFRVAPPIFEQFPGYVVAGVVVMGLTETGAYPDLRERLVTANAAAAERLRGVDLKSLPQIAVWRAAFQRLGISASTYPSAVEALARRAAKSSAVPSISPYVDLGNLASLTYLVPIGAHDTATWKDETLDVRPASSADTFQPVGSDTTERPDAGEIVYVTGNEVRTRRWVWRQSRQALVGPDAYSVLFPIDGFSAATEDAAQAAQAFIMERAVACGAAVRPFTLRRETPTAHWPDDEREPAPQSAIPR